MTRRLVLIAAAAALIAGACTSSSSSSAAPPSAATTAAASPSAAVPSATASSEAPSPAPSSPAALVVGGDRPVTVHVPASYDASRPAPLLILLHGFTASGADVDAYFNLAVAAEQHGLVYAAPDGTIDSQGNRFWNATDACCNFDHGSVDDVAYLSSVIADIQGKLAIDPNRIAVVGQFERRVHVVSDGLRTSRRHRRHRQPRRRDLREPGGLQAH